MAEYQQAKFYPFACETLGGISRSAKQVVGIIADVTVNNCTWLTRKAVMDEILAIKFSVAMLLWCMQVNCSIALLHATCHINQ